MGNVLFSDRELIIAEPLIKPGTTGVNVGRLQNKEVTIKRHSFPTKREAYNFANRVNAIAQLNHPNIPTLYTAESHDERRVQVITKYYKHNDLLSVI